MPKYYVEAEFESREKCRCVYPDQFEGDEQTKLVAEVCSRLLWHPEKCVSSVSFTVRATGNDALIVSGSFSTK